MVAFLWLYLLFLHHSNFSLSQFIRKWPRGAEHPCPVPGAAVLQTPPENRVSTGSAGAEQGRTGCCDPTVLAPAHPALCLLSPSCFSLKFCGITDDASKSLSLGFGQCPSLEEIMWVWGWWETLQHTLITLISMSASIWKCRALLTLLNTC